jgi:hypothetical protein
MADKQATVYVIDLGTSTADFHGGRTENNVCFRISSNSLIGADPFGCGTRWSSLNFGFMRPMCFASPFLPMF